MTTKRLPHSVPEWGCPTDWCFFLSLVGRSSLATLPPALCTPPSLPPSTAHPYMSTSADPQEMPCTCELALLWLFLPSWAPLECHSLFSPGTPPAFFHLLCQKAMPHACNSVRFTCHMRCSILGLLTPWLLFSKIGWSFFSAMDLSSGC